MIRKSYGVLAFLSFMFLLGSVGAVEQDTVSLGFGTFLMAVCLVAFYVFTWLAGGFDPVPRRENRPRRNRSNSGKHKRSR